MTEDSDRGDASIVCPECHWVAGFGEYSRSRVYNRFKGPRANTRSKVCNFCGSELAVCLVPFGLSTRLRALRHGAMSGRCGNGYMGFTDERAAHRFLEYEVHRYCPNDIEWWIRKDEIQPTLLDRAVGTIRSYTRALTTLIILSWGSYL